MINSVMMTFEEFTDRVQKELPQHLSENFYGAQLIRMDVNKPGRLGYKGLTVRKPGTTVSPTLNLDNMYGMYKKSPDTFTDILREAAEVCDVQPPAAPKIPESYDEARGQLSIRLTKDSEPGSNGYVTFSIFDIRAAVVLEYPQMDGIARVLVNEDLLELWGVDELTVIADAKARIKQSDWDIMPCQMYMMYICYNNDPYYLTGIEQELYHSGELMHRLDFDKQLAVLKEMCYREEALTDVGFSLIVLTNKRHIHGANVILCPAALNRVCTALDAESIIILPCSVHEVLVFPAESEAAQKFLKNTLMHEIVPEINRNEVLPEDVLSDKVLLYRKEGEVIEAL